MGAVSPRFSLFCHFGSDDTPAGWPTTGGDWDPSSAQRALDAELRFTDRAVAAGFEMLTVAEHHATPSSMVPNPVLMATVLAARYPAIRLLVMGPVLPLWDPIRLAEDLAMLDLVSAGRVNVGLFRGAATELAALGVGKDRARSRFDEGLELLRRAWTAPEPFGWHGEEFRHRLVSVWPRPVQQPHPPVLVAAPTPEAAAATAARDLGIGLLGALVTPDRAGELVAAYVAAGGNADQVLWRGRVLVGESDAAARDIVRAHHLTDPAAHVAPAGDGGARARAILGVAPERNSGPDRVLELQGDSEKVAVQLLDVIRRTGAGMIDLQVSMPGLPRAEAAASLARLCDEVLPAVRASVATV